MRSVLSPAGVEVTWEVHGAGPPLVLVHGSFADHRGSWAAILDDLARTWSVHAVARRGRGGTTATVGHGVLDEAADVVAVLRSLDGPAHLLGHSYGAQVALAAAWLAADRVDHLVLYEPPAPGGMPADVVADLAHHAERRAWSALAHGFFTGVLGLSEEEMAWLRASPEWPSVVADAEASWGDLDALRRYRFTPGAFRTLHVPTLLQRGSKSPHQLFVTDDLARELPDARVDELAGQGHEAMSTAPRLYVRSVRAHLGG